MYNFVSLLLPPGPPDAKAELFHAVQAFLTTGLDVDEQYISLLGRFTPFTSPRYAVDMRLGWSGAGADVSKEEKNCVILSRSTET
jgi:hypothetical protein